MTKINTFPVPPVPCASSKSVYVAKMIQDIYF